MADQPPRPRRVRTAQILSTVLFIAAIGFAAAALWIIFTDDSNSGPGTPPAANSAAEIDLAQVLAVLKASNDGWDYGRSPATVHTDQLPKPGQLLKLDDNLLFVFIFTGMSADDRIAAREAAGARVDLGAMQLTTPSGRVVNDSGQTLSMAEHSNVIAILVGGDEALADDVSQALATLP